jgi:D-alanyl-D-alanine carboxypeptidase (penicillin-binding protein 5/6)
MKKRIFIFSTVILVIVSAIVLVFNMPEIIWRVSRDNSNLHDKDSIFAISYSDSLLAIDIESPQGFVYNVSNDTIIFTKGEEKAVYPGSTTKLLTALYSLTILSPNEIITPQNELELVKEGSSIAYINEGHQLSVEMLIEGMLLPSGNDAAYVLAAAVGRKIANDPTLDGSAAIEVFIDGMQGYADSLGLCGTNFISPDGYSGKDHYTTTEDMIIISRLALKNEIIRKYASMYEDEVVYASGHTNTWHNTNKLLDPKSEFFSKHVIGLKTGSLDDEYCLVFAFRLDDGEYIAGVFGGETKNMRYRDALAIINEVNNIN